MDLEDHIASVVFLGEEEHLSGSVLRTFYSCKLLALQTLLEDFVNLSIGSRDEHHIAERVVSNLAAHGLEEIKTILEGFLERCEILDLDAGTLGELLHVGRELRLLDVRYLIRTPCRENLYIEGLVVRNLLVPLKGVYRVIGCADELDIRSLDDVPNGHRLVMKLLVAEIPNLFSGIAIEVALIAEIFPEL